MSVSGAGKVTLLYIVGGTMERIADLGSRIRVYGSTDLTKLLLDREPHHRLHVTPNFFRKARRPELDDYRVLLNLITEPEQNERVLQNLKKLLRGLPGRVVNRPEAVLRSTRDQVARQLAGTPGLIVPPAVRLAAGKAGVAAAALNKAGIAPPVILREAGTHGGKIVGCFEDVDSLVAALDRSADHLATQFVDFRSADGLYRKYRVFFIGPHLILRHMLVSDAWNVHAKDRTRFMVERPELVAEEQALFESDAPFPPNVEQTLQAVRERIPLDFFGMDFGVTADGQVVLFEANATMSFFPFAPDPQFAYLQRCFKPAQAAFRELLGLPPLQPGAPLRFRLETA